MSQKTLSQEQILLSDKHNHLHPWEDINSIGKQQRTMANTADGIYLYDDKGKKLIDGPGGMWCVQIGYNRSEMAEAIAEQATKLCYNSPWNTSSSPAAILAKSIADKTPGDLNHVMFTGGGSTAVDSALRFVQFYNNRLKRPQKKMILSREKAYHGSTYLSASVSGKPRDKTWLDGAHDLVHFLPDVNPILRKPDQSMEAFCDEKINDLQQAVVTLGADKIAAYIAEPILASGGVIVPPKGYHQRCLEICRANDILYISDEVVTAFGRLGHWFASEAVFGIVPDIITCAKGITSGYQPLGACIIANHLIEEIQQKSIDQDEEVVFSNGYTFSGHPVACAAALKNIEIIEREQLLEHVREITPYFQQRLEALRELPIVVDVRGEGLVGCVECSISGKPNTPLDEDKNIGYRIDAHCQELGLIVRPIINMCVFSPPLTITKDEIDLLMDKLEEGIGRAMQELKEQNIRVFSD